MTLALVSGCAGAGISQEESSPGETRSKDEVTDEARTESGDETLQVQLGLHRKAMVDDLTVHWLSVNDSRCPTGVQCVWAGRVTVEVEVSGSTSEAEVVSLSSPVPAGEKPPLALGYRISLVSVNPYPQSGKEARESDYVAILELIPET